MRIRTFVLLVVVASLLSLGLRHAEVQCRPGTGDWWCWWYGEPHEETLP